MNNPKVKITVKNFGTMTAELYPDMAPKTVENFVKLVKEGFYEGLIFHRVIPGFMIQGGGFDTEYEQKEADSIRGEFRGNGFAQNTLKTAFDSSGCMGTAAAGTAKFKFHQFIFDGNDFQISAVRLQVDSEFFKTGNNFLFKF